MVYFAKGRRKYQGRSKNNIIMFIIGTKKGQKLNYSLQVVVQSRWHISSVIISVFFVFSLVVFFYENNIKHKNNLIQFIYLMTMLKDDTKTITIIEPRMINPPYTAVKKVGLSY